MKRTAPITIPFGGGYDAKAPRVDGGEEWSCTQCGNVNFAGRMTCNMRRCGAPKPGTGHGGGGGCGGSQAGGQWDCPSCGNSNYEGRLFCNLRKCGVARPGLTAAQLAAAGGVAGMAPQPPPAQMAWGAPMGAPMGAPRGGGGGSGGGRPPPEGSWVCLECQNVNFPQRAACNGRGGKCGMPREQADGGYPQAAQAWGAGQPPAARPGDAAAILQTIASAGLNPNALTALLGSVGVNLGGRGGPAHGGLLPGGVLPAKQGGPPPDGSWICLACSNVNFPQRASCNGKACGRTREEVDGGPPPEGASALQPKTHTATHNPAAGDPEGSWLCPHCQNVNWPTRSTCNKRSCGQPRPEGF